MVGNLNHLPARRWPTRARELLDQFGLSDAGDRTLKTYSGGMRRRLDLAAALVARPTVLFLDEPTTGLDPQSRNDLWEVIERLVGGGTTVLLTTQYLEEADRLARHAVGARPRTGHRRGHPGRVEGRHGCDRARGRARTARTTRPGDRELLGPSGPTPPQNGTVVEVTVDNGPEAAMAGTALARPGGDRPVLVHLARAEPRRRLPGPHRPAGRGRRPSRRRRPGRSDRPEAEAQRRRGRRTAAAPEAMPDRNRRSSHDHHHRRTHPVGAPPATDGGPGPVGPVGHLDRHQAQPAGAHPHPRGPVLLDGAADHVRAAVPLRVRWCHPAPRAPTTSTI